MRLKLVGALFHVNIFQVMENGSGGLGQHAQQRVEQELEPGRLTRAMGRSMLGCPAAAMEQKLKSVKVRWIFPSHKQSWGKIANKDLDLQDHYW